jgi:hypothetical protein
MKYQYRCSVCTQSFCSDVVAPMCSLCYTTPTLTCDQCGTPGVDSLSTCTDCTPRPHICLSRCQGARCVRAKGPDPRCHCGIDGRRWQVQKPGRNHGRFFWSCMPGNCKYFQWERPIMWRGKRNKSCGQHNVLLLSIAKSLWKYLLYIYNLVNATPGGLWKRTRLQIVPALCNNFRCNYVIQYVITL